MITNEQLTELFENTFKECDTYYQISDKLHEMKDNANIDSLRRYFCNQVLYFVTMGYVK